MTEKPREIIPDPKRLIEGLRDTGYEFNTAVADLIDNCIAANATHVDVFIATDIKGQITLMIADNGSGMNEDQLENAMKYGSDVRPNPASLGKYGLGLKTASTAFCRRLSVLSRPGVNLPTWTATWDLDVVRDEGKWLLLMTDQPEQTIVDRLNLTAPGASGTVVVWKKVDRLIKDYADPGGSHARKALEKKIAELKKHSARVYQRFLDPQDTRASNISLAINGEKIAPWNPFLPGYSELAASEEIEVQTESGKDASFTVKAYILPRREEFSDPEVAKSADITIERQGLYIYRENRLIVDADWLGIYSKEPHGNLLRVEFSFDHRLDEAFDLDIMKSQIILNEELYGWLRREFLPAPRREANRRYRIGQQKKVEKSGADAHDTSNTNIGNREVAAGGARITVSDASKNEVLVENSKGKFIIKMPVASATKAGQVYVQPVESINDGLLYEPVLIDQRRGVRLNMSHPYYHKVYVPNLAQSVTLQGMDALLWALAIAESTSLSDATADSFAEMRFEVSKILRTLVESLPEPRLTDGDDE